MDKQAVVEQIRKTDRADLLEWKAHVLYCLQYYQKLQDEFEIGECTFVLEMIDRQLEALDGKPSDGTDSAKGFV